MSAPAARPYEHVLIIKPSSPGDILHALPVARAMRAAWPKTNIAWLVASNFAEMLTDEPSVSEIIPFDRKRFARIGREMSVTRDFLAFVADLRRREFDLVLDLQGLFRSGFMAWSARASRRVGFRDARELAWLFYNTRIPRAPADTHAAERNLRSLDLLGVPRGKPDFRPYITDSCEASARGLLWEHGLSSVTQFAMLVPSTRWETKRWPPERFGQLAAAIHAEFGLICVLVGGRDDADAGRIVHENSGGATVNLCGLTSLPQLAALVRMARIVVTADSTPMHMAAAFGVSLVALFGPTNPQRTGPFGRGGDVLRLDLPCSPCYFRKLEQCPHQHKCMQDMDVARVMREVTVRLQQSVGVA